MKKVMTTLLAGLILGMAPAAYAAPVKVTGEATLKYERDTATGEPDQSGMIYSLKLMGEADFGSGWSLYARVGTQGLSHPGLGDFNTDFYGEDEESMAALDQFGLIFQDKALTYKLGRQDVTVGTAALLYCRDDAKIGQKAFVDGLSVTGTVGRTEVSAVLAREDNPAGQPENKLYAVRAGFNPEENINWGLTLGHYSSDDSTNHWAVDGTYKFAKHSVTGQYAQSNSDTDDKAYVLNWNYDANDKTAFFMSNFRVEAKGDMGGQSDFDNGNRGWYYGITHNLREDTNLEIVYKDQREISSGTKNTKLEATLSYSF